MSSSHDERFAHEPRAGSPGGAGRRILVTGASGFLGGAVVERLLAHGEGNVRCLVRAGSRRGRLDALATGHPGRLELFTGAIGSKEAAAKVVEGMEIIVHLAAAMGGAPADMFLSTVVASKNLLEALAARPRNGGGAPPKIVLVSSFGVYGVADLPRGHVIDESTPLEPHPERRDVYSQTKLRQEKLFREYQQKLDFTLTVLRPGVIYGPGGSAFSSRVGLSLFGVFLHLGRENLLPLSYVDNCAEAIVLAALRDEANGQVYNVHDDELLTAAQYLERYKREVRSMPSVRLPYSATVAMSAMVERYHRYSKGQLPAIFTPYKTASSWKGNGFDNARLKRLGWRPLVSTDEGLRRTFESLRAKA